PAASGHQQLARHRRHLLVHHHPGAAAGQGLCGHQPGRTGADDVDQGRRHGRYLAFHGPRAHIRPMSVAFTREEDLEATAANLPDRPISPHPNLVTPEGLARIEAELAAARAARAAAQSAGDMEIDRTAMARATRDLRYWSARRASAQLVEPGPSDGAVRFGGSVTIEREDGRTQTWRIV